MRNRALLIGPGLAVLLVLIAIVVFPWRSSDSRPDSEAPPPPAVAFQPVPGADGIGDPYFPQAGNGGYDVTGYDIQIRYDPPSDRLEGHTTVTARATQDLSQFNLDLRLPATAVAVDGQPASFRQDGGELQVTPAAAVRAGQPMSVLVDYVGVPSSIPGGGRFAEPWVRTADGAVAVGEPDSAAWWYPSNDHPSDKATVAVTVTVPAGVEAISNGALLGGPEPAGPGWERWRWQAGAPMATYLAFVAIGQYDLVRRDTEFGPYLAAYAQGLDPQVVDAARASVERTPEITRFLAGIFGPYPFSNLGGVVPNAPGLGFALETQTRPVYSPVFWGGGEPDVRVVVHELAHQWFGDSVSVSRWSDIWLNEGFATYAEWLYTERTGGRSAQQMAELTYQRRPAGTEYWRTTPGDPGAADVFSGPVYTRGAMALQALRVEVGDEDFFAALRTWTTERRGGNGTVADFLAVIERVSNEQVDDVAQTWLFTPSRPPSPPT
ncbi:MAG TPA: M1 family metallopeptidase [Pseudonocardiaceae bacterium]|nr:M1 family metallopeptidase [Pseudonocardiaceae bacterium]